MDICSMKLNVGDKLYYDSGSEYHVTIIQNVTNLFAFGKLENSRGLVKLHRRLKNNNSTYEISRPHNKFYVESPEILDKINFRRKLLKVKNANFHELSKEQIEKIYSIINEP